MDYSSEGYQLKSDPYRNYTVKKNETILVRTYSALNKYPDKSIINRQNNQYTVLCHMEKHKEHNESILQIFSIVIYKIYLEKLKSGGL